MKKFALALACAAVLAACAFEPSGEAVVPDATEVQADAPLRADAGADAAQPTPDAPPAPIDAAPVPDAAPDTHEIYCGNSNGTTIEFRGNIRTGLNVAPPSGTPSYVGYGSDTGGAPWPSGSTPNASSSLGSIVVNGAVWTIPVFSQGDSVQGVTPYAVVDGMIKWFDIPNKWTVMPDQYCTKSPSGTKLCTCETLPCTPASATRSCVN